MDVTGLGYATRIQREDELSFSRGIKEIVMPSRFILILLMLLLFLSLLSAGCATERPLQKKSATPPVREKAEGQLEAIPEPVSPRKKPASQVQPPSSYIEQEVPANVEESDVASGYRVQIFASSSLEKAEEVAGKARNLFPERVYVEYSAPLYRVRVGNFTSKDAALQFREKMVQSGYEGAWVVEALIERE
jgi:cell division septation protein DedD